MKRKNSCVCSFFLVIQMVSMYIIRVCNIMSDPNRHAVFFVLFISLCRSLFIKKRNFYHLLYNLYFRYVSSFSASCSSVIEWRLAGAMFKHVFIRIDCAIPITSDIHNIFAHNLAIRKSWGML